MSDEQLSELERAWAVLSPPRAQALSSFTLDVSFENVPCRVAVDAAGARHVLIPVSGETVEADQHPSLLALAVRRLAFESDDATYVDLSCAERDLFPEFDDVVADVLSAAHDSDRPGAAAVRAVMRWRRLFRSRLVRGLSYQARLGLFAELTVLSSLLDAEPRLPVDVWRGPLREPHDFEAPERCLEVKALGPETETITVHGLTQLDTHGERALDLILVRVSEDPQGATLTDLVSNMCNRIDSRASLRARLNAAGWSDSEEAGPKDTQAFIIGEVQRVEVNQSVPRLIAGDLIAGAMPEGLQDLRYAIHVPALLPHATSASLRKIAEEACR